MIDSDETKFTSTVFAVEIAATRVYVRQPSTGGVALKRDAPAIKRAADKLYQLHVHLGFQGT
jgi:hypothetical protein